MCERLLAIMLLRVGLKAMALVAAVTIFGVACIGSTPRSADAASSSGWALAANRSCRQMENRMENHPAWYWNELAVYPPRNFPRVAYLRRVWWKVHRDGLAEISAHAAASRATELRAEATYRYMLRTILAVAKAADSAKLAAYNDADVRMRRAILATRAAFRRAGAARICTVAI